MSEALKQWMYNIIIFILFSSLIQHLAAEKKYDRRRKPNEEIIGSDTGL